jgi:hypothetical protein
MSYSLAITIPTFNRPEQLNSVLHSIMTQASIVPVSIYIFDDSDNQATKNLYEGHWTSYSFIKYIKNETTLGHDDNILKCLSFPSEDYVWIVADSRRLIDGMLQYIYSMLTRYDPDICCVNIKKNQKISNKTSLFKPKSQDVRDFLLETFAWHAVLTGVSIYSRTARFTLLKNLKVKFSFKNFPQLLAIFGSVANEGSFLWCQKECIEQIDRGQSYWRKDVIKVFLEDLPNALDNLPVSFSITAKKKAFREHTKQTKILTLRSIALYRVEGIFNLSNLKSNWQLIRLNAGSKTPIILLICCLPVSLLKILYLIKKFVDYCLKFKFHN